MKISLTFLSVLVSFISLGQVIHIDTLQITTEKTTRYESLNGKIVGSRPFYIHKEDFNINEGYNKIYRSNGQLYLEGKFIKINDSTYSKKGEFKYYDKNGNLDYSHDYENNHRTYFYFERIKKSEGMTTLEGNKLGIWKCYYRSGQIKSVGKMNGDLKYGVWKYYDELGNLKEKKRFKRFTANYEQGDCCDW